MVALGLILLVVAVLFFLLIKRSPNWIRCLISGVVIFLFLGFSVGFVPVPIGVRHIVHLSFPPEDLYHPIVTDKFSFHEKEYSRTYFLKPKYLDIYEVGMRSSEGNFPSTYKFSGKIKFDFYHNEEHLFEKTLSSCQAVYYTKNDYPKIHAISFITFDLPLMGKYKDNLSVKVTVVEADEFLKNYIESTELYIKVSATP